MTFSKLIASAALVAAAYPLTTLAAETPIGKPHTENGMEVAAVYLQPIEMDPPGMMLAAEKADIHLEADIHATKDNVNGFANGDWVPNLEVTYKLVKEGKTVAEGPAMAMVASDGPHYGDNIKLAGPGKYKVKYTILPPSANPHSHFGRHTDRATGVRPWFKPFDVEYEFSYVGIGKKGGY